MTKLTDLVAKIVRADTCAPGAPDVIRRVVHVEVQSDVPIVMEAVVVMFDGLPGRVRLGEFNLDGEATWWVGWKSLGGGDMSFEDGQWVRRHLDGSQVLPILQPNDRRLSPRQRTGR
jgi:hypothetical protein